MASRSKGRWNEVGQRFSRVGERFRAKLKAAEDDRVDALEADRRAIRLGLRTLAEDVEKALDSISEPIRDPQIRDELRRAARSIGKALGEQVTELGEGLRARFEQAQGSKSRATHRVTHSRPLGSGDAHRPPRVGDHG